MAALKTAPAVIDLLFISAEDYMDRTPAVPTTSEPIPLAHPASHLAIPFDPTPPPGCPAYPAELTNIELTAPSNKVDLFQYLVQISEPVLTNFTVYRDMAGLSKPKCQCKPGGVPSVLTSLYNQSDLS